MLRRNLDTTQGLENGALGTVSAITKEYIQVTFDHTPNLQFKIERIRSKFQILRRFYVYRKQFPLILTFAVTIHKCNIIVMTFYTVLNIGIIIVSPIYDYRLSSFLVFLASAMSLHTRCIVQIFIYDAY